MIANEHAKMKKIINTINMVPQIMYVPADWRRCTVTGEFLPLEEFMRDGVVVRTNGLKAYNMPLEEMEATGKSFKQLQKSIVWSNMWEVLNAKYALKDAGISVKEMKAYLDTLKDDDMLIMTQEGYYASGEYADVFTHGETKSLDGVTYHVIGHSNQDY